MGLFITFEGPEGSGKTTQVQRLAERLRRAGYPVLTTREPGGTTIGDQIRAVLHDLRNREMDPRTEVLLYAASRAQLVAEVVRPALARGTIVLCDRYTDSTLAYQGYGRGLDLDVLKAMMDFATGGLKPHLTLYLDLPVEKGLARKQEALQRGEGEWNRLDQEDVAFHRRVRAGYHALAAAEPGRWRVLNADRPIEVVQTDVWEAVVPLLERERT
ncbi:MAG: dTMP kinase [Chloroflexi bacterium]|nr:MAG: dTMP kinase [Chloroflexota bacterium]